MIALKRFLLALAVLMIALVLSLMWLLRTDSGAAWALQQAERVVGGALRVGQVEGNFHSGIVARDTSWNDDSVRLQITEVTARASLGIFPPRLSLNDVEVVGSNVNIREATDDSAPAAAFDLADLLNGLALPIEASFDNVRIRDTSIHRADAVQDIELVAVSGEWHNALSFDSLQIELEELNVAGSAYVDLQNAHAATLQLQIAGQGIGEHQVAVTGSRNADSYVFEQFSVDGQTASISGTATIAMGTAASLSASMTFSKLYLHHLLTSWPEEQVLTGRLDITADDARIVLPQFELQIAGSSAELAGAIDYGLATGQVSGQLRWKELQWPIAAANPSVQSEFADLRLGGNLDDWTIDGDVALLTPTTPQGILRLQASGDRNATSVEIVSGAIIGGEFSGTANYSWQDSQAWSASLQFQEMAVGEILEHWPGELSGQISGNGELREQSAELQLSEVTGLLRNKRVQASGGLTLTRDSVLANDLHIQFGASSAALSGAPELSAGLTFDVTVSEMSELMSDADGSLQASGRYWRAGELPRLAVDLQSDRLRVGDIQVEGLVIKDRDDAGALLHADISADTLLIAGQLVSNIAARSRIASDAQDVDLQLSLLETELQLSLVGAVEDPDAAWDSEWRGELTNLTIRATEQHELRLADAVELIASRQRAALETACFEGSLGSRVCLDGQWQAGGQSAGSIQLAALPLSILDQFVSTELAADQQLSGKLDWQTDAQNKLSANAELLSTAGQLRSLRNEQLVLHTGPGAVAFVVEGGKLLSGTLSLPLPGNGTIEGNLSLRDISAGTRGAVSGDLQVAVSDISILGHFSPLVDTASGSLQADVNLEGSANDPVVSGNIAFSDGEIEYLPIGLDLTEINLQAELRRDRNTNLRGTFRAGDGVGTISSAASYKPDELLALDFSLSGERLTLIDVPDLRAVVDADVEIGYAPGQVTVGGEVVVGEAHVRPTTLVNGAVAESEDVVIIAGQLPETDAATNGESTLQILGGLTVTLGDNVNFDVSVARATASGSADFSWSGDTMPIANGRYDLRGQVQAFGQVLDITEGRVRFADVAANNPALRIRAEREIFGNTQVKKAGVFIDGNADNPRVETYTTPQTTEERALTLLATGSDFDYEQGVGAVDFGTYIAPRLFVSYGVSLFGRDNVISARYDLSKGFGIKATSGSEESGVDLNYRLEN